MGHVKNNLRMQPTYEMYISNLLVQIINTTVLKHLQQGKRGMFISFNQLFFNKTCYIHVLVSGEKILLGTKMQSTCSSVSFSCTILKYIALMTIIILSNSDSQCINDDLYSKKIIKQYLLI